MGARFNDVKAKSARASLTSVSFFGGLDQDRSLKKVAKTEGAVFLGPPEWDVHVHAVH